MGKITQFLWFDGEAEPAARYYVSLFPNSSINSVVPLPEGGVLLVSFTLDGKEYIALNGGPYQKLSPAYSQLVHCDDQAEVDHYWEALSQGGEKGVCGWLVDQFGASWQVAPRLLGELMGKATPEQAARVLDAVRAMTKLEIAVLQAAFDGV